MRIKSLSAVVFAVLALPAAAFGQASAEPSSEPVTLTRSETRDMQRALDVTADGEIGPQTRRALRRFERSERFAVDGRPDAEVLDALDVEWGDDDEAATPATGEFAEAVEAAESVIGSPYASGGTDPSGFDCSGLTGWAFKQAGFRLPRDSYGQFEIGTSIRRSEIAPGDLVFFDTAGEGASHVAIAVSNRRVISTTSSGGVMEHTRRGDYWGGHYHGARRLTASDLEPARRRR